MKHQIKTGALFLIIGISALTLVLLSACSGRPPVKIGPVYPVPTTTAIPGTHWRLAKTCTPQDRCIRWWDAQTGWYYQGPYSPADYYAYGLREYCAFLPQQGDAYVSEVKDEVVQNPPPAGCPLP